MPDPGGSNVSIKGIVWLGTRTERFAEMRDFIVRITGREPWIDQHEFAVFDLPNGDRIEVFGPHGEAPPFEAPVPASSSTTSTKLGPSSSERESRSSVRSRAENGNAWSHFRAPDGHVYEITSRPDHPTHAESRG